MVFPGGGRLARSPVKHSTVLNAPARFVVAVLTVALAAGCTMPAVATPSPRPSPTATASPSPPPPTASPSPTPVPTPDRGAIPDFAAGEIVATATDGLRVRQRPGTGASVVAGLLPLGAQLGVIMGPFPDGGFGWYLVRDADGADPAFAEGWIAAGYEPDPFLISTGETSAAATSVASLAGTGPAEEGPIQIGDGDHVVRWIAADPERIGCRFAVSLTPAGGDPVPTIRATVGSGVDRGTLQPQTFEALGVTGAAFVTVDSDCDWAFALERASDRSPSPSADDGG
jgi:hypothetical protein